MTETSDRERFENYCKSEIFRNHVREAINTDYLNIFFNNLRLTQKINDQIDSKLSDYKSTNKTLVQKNVNTILQSSLPDLVQKQINMTLPSIVANNYQMQKMFDKHCEDLDVNLGTVAKNIIERIASDEQYHEINKAYFNAFNLKGDKHIMNLETKNTEVTTKFNNIVTSTIESLNNKGNSFIRELQDKYTNDTKEMSKYINESKDNNVRIQKLESQISYISWTLVGVSVLGVCSLVTNIINFRR